MGDNVILNDRDECIGYYKDLKKVIEEQLKEFLKEDNYEEVESMLEELKELETLKEYGGLIICSDNNGMGFTAREYKHYE